MNNIFKVIWNHATQTWTAVGELASAKGKSKSVKLAAISTTLLAVVAGGVQAADVVTKAEDRGGLAIGTTTVSAQFYGNADYTAKTGLNENKAGAEVNAYDGIAIGNGALSGSNSGTAGNAHVAIGLMSQATGNTANGKVGDGANGQNAAVALGAYSLATGQGSTAIGAHAVANELDSVAVGKIANAKGQSSTAIGQQAEAIQRATATGAQSKALGTYSTAMGQSAKANSWDSITVGSASTVSGKNSINVGSNSVLSGQNIAAVGANSKISSGNVSTLGSNITVAAGRDGAVVLGYGSDAGVDTTKVIAVNSTTAEGSPLVYSGFAGNLGGKDETGTNNTAASKQGNFVSVGSANGGERQIKHIAAGEITADSTDAINGSQLYQVAKTLGTAANQTANALGVTLNKDGTLSPFSHKLNVTTSGYTQPENATNVTTALTQLNDYVNAGWTVGDNAANDVSKILPNGKVNFIDGNGTTATVTANGTNGANVTFNVKQDVTANTTTGLKDGGANNVLNVGKDGVSVVSGTINNATTSGDNAGKVTTSPDTKDNQVATVKNVVDAINSAGFKVSANNGEPSLIKAGDTLNFSNGNGVDVVNKDGKFTFNVNTTSLAGKVTAATTSGNDAGKVTVSAADKGKLATVDTVAEAINSSFWTARVENNDKQVVKTADNSANATIKAGSNVAFVAGKNLVVNQTTTGNNTVFTYGLADKIEVSKITVKPAAGEADKGTTVENGKVTNLDDHLTAPAKVTGGNVVNATEVKTPTLTDEQKKEAATVNDVLNAGWNLKTNGNQTAAITNGKGLDFASDDNSVTITPTVDKDGNAKVNFSVNATSVINNNKGTIKEAATDPKAANAGKVTVTGTPQPKANGSMETQDEANAREGNKVATVQNVVNAINSAATFVKVADSQEVITASTANDNGVAVKSGDTVTHTAGKNLKVKRDGQSVTYALAQDIDVDSVKAKNAVTIGSGDNATTITSNDKGLNLAGKDGAATNINNVKDADLNSRSKQAVNGSQLHATNEKVANLGTTVKNLNNVINHHAGAIDSLDRKVNKHSKQARAGIAGANAAAALPQAYTQGKAMVAAAAGTFKGQNALAVGYSRISDNGKIILKLQGNANTSGDIGAGVGVGYQW